MHKFAGFIDRKFFYAFMLSALNCVSAYGIDIDTFTEDKESTAQKNAIVNRFEHDNKNTYKNFSQDYDDLDAYRKGIDSNLGGEQMRESPSMQAITMNSYLIAEKWYHPKEANLNDTFEGVAGMYDFKFRIKKTSNGEIYNMHAHTAAHTTLPINTVIKVYNLENGKSTIVRINDRGPFTKDQMILLSNVAAQDIGMTTKGSAKVKIKVIGFKGVVDATLQNELKIDEVSQEEPQTTPQQTLQKSPQRFAIQVGAFRNKIYAIERQEKFTSYYPYTTAIKQVFDSDKRTFYRVFLEGFKSEQEARDFMKNLRGFKDAFITKD
ncbi:MAG: septal ring lytic transglycosylase RlpA family protein [Helicobacter sp.]|nr:septal ring lytic transglycosylase RlpA family protein [Helicobacter sp.]